MKTPPPTVLIQVDLDSLWAVKAAYGLPVTRTDLEEDPLYDLGLARFLDLFEERGVRATFFAIGRDCEVAAKQALLRRASEAGHEIANHSHTHPIGLGNLPAQEIESEIRRASAAIEAAVGRRPVGFRAPGFDASPAVLQAAARAGMVYDSSLLPTRAGPVLRGAAAFFRQRGAKRAAPGRYGSGPVWKAPRQPYYPDLEIPWKARGFLEPEPAIRAKARTTNPSEARGFLEPEPATRTKARTTNPWKARGFLEAEAGNLLQPEAGGAARAGVKAVSRLVELPVAVTARLRLPVHCSVGMAAGWTWTRRTLRRLAGGEDRVLVYVFHGIDLVGGEHLAGLPGGAAGRRVFLQPFERKRAFVERVLDFLQAHFTARVSRDYVVEKLKGDVDSE